MKFYILINDPGIGNENAKRANKIVSLVIAQRILIFIFNKLVENEFAI